MRSVYAFCVAGVFGCSPPSDSATAETDPGPWPDLPVVEEDGLGAAWTAEEAADALATALSEVPSADQVLDAYLELLSHGDGTCPSHPTQILDDSLTGCTSDDGHFFAGVSNYAAGTGTLDGVTYDYREMSGDFWIVTPDGLTMEGGGHGLSAVASTQRIGELQGSWVWHGGEPWLAHGFSGIYELEQVDDSHLAVTGAVDLLGIYVFLDGLVFSCRLRVGPRGRPGRARPQRRLAQHAAERLQPVHPGLLRRREHR